MKNKTPIIIGVVILIFCICITSFAAVFTLVYLAGQDNEPSVDVLPTINTPTSEPRENNDRNQPQSTKKYDNTLYSYSLYYKDTWSLNANSSSKTAILTPPVGSGGDAVFQPNLNVIVESLGGADISLIEYKNLALDNLENALTGFELVETDETIVNGNSAAVLRYNYEYGTTNVSIKQYIFLENGNTYIVTTGAESDSFATWEDEFDKVVSTIEIN